MLSNELTLKSGTVLEFDGLIRSHVETDDLHICVVTGKIKGKKCSTLSSFNERGEILWLRPIEEGAMITPFTGSQESEVCVKSRAGKLFFNPYTGDFHR